MNFTQLGESITREIQEIKNHNDALIKRHHNSQRELNVIKTERDMLLAMVERLLEDESEDAFDSAAELLQELKGEE